MAMERVAKKDTGTTVDVDNATILTEYEEDARTMGLTDRTIANYMSSIKAFSEFISKPFPQVDIGDLRGFLRHLTEQEHRGRPFSPKTISRYFSAVDSLYSYLEFEKYVAKSIVPQFRKRYLAHLRKRGNNHSQSERQLISVEQMRQLVNSILDPRDRAVVVLLAKTGLRRAELVNIDIDDIDWLEQRIRLKDTPKRSFNLAFFDDECSRVLKRWMMVRETWNKKDEKALFLNERGGRLNRNGIYELVVKHAEKVSLHNPESRNLKERFTPHCCRHWFTTWLLRNGMTREYVKTLRGDARREAIDIYFHIDPYDLRKSYIHDIPKLGL